MYGPQMAKMLARMTIGGPEATSMNNDNYVFFLISHFLQQRYKHPVKFPKWNSKTTGKRQSDGDELFDDSDPGDDPPEPMASGLQYINDDSDFYGGTVPNSEPKPHCYGGNGPVGTTSVVDYGIDIYCGYTNVSLSCDDPYIPGAYNSNNDPHDDSNTWLSMRWDGGKMCQGLGPEVLEKDECKARFSTILNSCDSGKSTAKHGGWLQVGCLFYDMTIVEGHSTTPPLGFDAMNGFCNS
jgi:hypothetical protein